MQRRLKDINFLDVVLWIFRAVIIGGVIWGSIATIIENPYPINTWIETIIAGVAQGSLYALIAIGYTLVYGVLFMINFAHGEFFMAGILTATIFLAQPWGKSGFLNQYPIFGLAIITILSITISVGIALLTERVAYRPLRKAPRLVPLITAIGKGFPQLEILAGKISVFGLLILKTHAVVIVSAVLMLIGLYIFIMKTKVGKSIRAVAENKDVAALMGIDVDRAVTITFATGAAMAGIAGVLYALVFRQVHFFMGFIPGIKAFTAAVLGGIGSIPGAALGGLLLGMFESVGPGLFLEGLGIPAPHQLKDVIAFTLLVLILILRPQGILGERISKEKA